MASEAGSGLCCWNWERDGWCRGESIYGSEWCLTPGLITWALSDADFIYSGAGMGEVGQLLGCE